MSLDLELKADTVHIWHCDLSDRSIGDPSVLDEAERAKAAAYRFERDRVRYVVGRSFLKVLLARYLKRAIAGIALSSGEFGKPFLADSDRLKFNVSHCANVYLVALTLDHEVGVDVELHRTVDDLHDTADMVFSGEELATLSAVPGSEASRAFLRGWTRKEAFVKACGVGIGIELKAISVGLEPEIRFIAPIPGVSTQAYAVRSLNIDEGVVAALACCPSVSTIDIYRSTDLRDI